MPFSRRIPRVGAATRDHGEHRRRVPRRGQGFEGGRGVSALASVSILMIMGLTLAES